MKRCISVVCPHAHGRRHLNEQGGSVPNQQPVRKGEFPARFEVELSGVATCDVDDQKHVRQHEAPANEEHIREHAGEEEAAAGSGAPNTRPCVCANTLSK